MQRAIIMLATVTAMSCSVATGAEAVKPHEAAAYIDTMGQRALAALRSAEDPGGKLLWILREGVDFAWICKRALGREGRQASTTRIEELGHLVSIQVTENTLDRLHAAAVTVFVIGKLRTMPNGDILVDAAIYMNDGQSVATGWRVAQRNGRPRIVDVEFEGYSMRIHYQNKFERKLNFGGVDGLINSLRQQVRDRDPARAVSHASAS